MKEFLYVLLIGFILGSVTTYFVKPSEVVERTDSVMVTSTKIDTMYFTQIKLVERLKAKLDTIFIDRHPAIVAVADTILKEDSSTIAVKYYFPPLNYFNIAADIKQKTIYKTITNDITKIEYVRERFGYGIYAGTGYDVVNKNFGIQIGLGVFYSF